MILLIVQASVDLFKNHIKDFKDPVRGPHLLIEEAVLLAEEAIMQATQCPRSILIAGTFFVSKEKAVRSSQGNLCYIKVTDNLEFFVPILNGV